MTLSKKIKNNCLKLKFKLSLNNLNIYCNRNNFIENRKLVAEKKHLTDDLEKVEEDPKTG